MRCFALPQKITPPFQKVTLFGNSTFADNQVKMRSLILSINYTSVKTKDEVPRVGPNLIHLCFYNRGNLDTHTHTQNAM